MPDMKTGLTRHVQGLSPNNIPPITAIAARARRRRSRRRLGVLGGTAVAAGIAAGAIMQFPTAQHETAQDNNEAQVAAPSDKERVVSEPQPTGEVPVEGTFACARGPFTPEAVTNAGFAFDGTITKIDGGSADDGFDERTVTFSVTEWFRGGDGDTVAVTMYRPKETAPPSYDVGSRLLVSGGHGNGSFVAWPCGRTRYYDSDTADAWRRLTQ